ncbi:MAG: small cysteine-rich outer membrane protein [Eubacterium sp.]|nr:small cysteine-rich outer membrane protein [Eubacterium sp.]
MYSHRKGFIRKQTVYCFCWSKRKQVDGTCLSGNGYSYKVKPCGYWCTC